MSSSSERWDHRLTIRRLSRRERGAYVEHLLRLDTVARRLRFCGAMSDEAIVAFAASIPPRAMLIGAFVEGTLRGVAELRRIGPAYGIRAEAAFSVEEAFRSRGLGGMLMASLILRARNQGVRHLEMTCLPENHAMQAIARRFGGVLTTWPGERHGVLNEAGPTPFTLAREAWADGSAQLARWAEAWLAAGRAWR